MKLVSLFFLSCFCSLLAKEVSVFGAGDLESSKPYGLTSAEKVILKNKKKLTKFDRKIDDTRSEVEILSERIDGIASIVDGDSSKLNSAVLKLKKISLDIEAQNLSIEDTKNSLQETTNTLEVVKTDLESYIQLQNSNMKLLEDKVKELTILVNKINKNYVSKKEFDELVAFINKKRTKPTKKKSVKAKNTFSGSNKDLLAKAKALFKKDYFTKAIPIFEHLIVKKYKPAECNFYLGEIWFYRKKYQDAIAYFKKSMMLYDKAKYIPTLLLHSAISFERIKDINNATTFYGTLVDIYPETKEAQQAQENLIKLKQ